MAHIVTLDLDSPDPTDAINAFLHVMNAQRALRLTPRTEHVLIEHLMREDVRVLYYSSACGIVSIVEGRDHPMDDDGFDETLEVIDLFAKRRKRKREADRVGDMRREMVAGDLDEALPTSGSGAGEVNEEPWIEWTGGLRPVPDDTLVEVRYLDKPDPLKGTRIEWPMPASRFCWQHDREDDDIIAYRIVAP